MAVRPLVTTGAALLSAGALVAATPALFVPRDEIVIVAPTAAPKLTQEQINLLALSLQGAWQAFTQGYGGIYIPGTVYEYDANGDIVTDANGNPVTVEAPGDCTATGAVCKTGFTGLAYYLSDNLLPLGNLDNIFFEGGFTALAHVALRSVALAIDAIDPTGRLDLTKRVDDFFEGGITQLVGNLLLDNLPQNGFAYGLTKSFFFGYGVNNGIYAAFTYVVDAIAQGTPTPNPDPIKPLTSGPATETTLLASNKTGVTSTSLPEKGALLNLSTTNLESSLKNLVKSPFQAPAAGETKLVKDLGVTEQDVNKGTVEGGTGTTPAGAEVPTPEAPKPEAPKAPELTLPELKLDLNPKSSIKAKEVPAEDSSGAGSEGASTGVDTTTGNKVTPPTSGDGKPKGESNGGKFLKNLDNAVKNLTGAGAGKGKGTDSGKVGGNK
jgi:hypothetical protein